MKLSRFGVLLPLSLVMVTACAPQTKYSWGGYEGALYSYYKNPTEAKGTAEVIAKTIADAEGKGKKVPPGLYAEYGYLQLELGGADAAIASFEKEKAAWPESAALMDNMIKTARIPTKAPAGQ